MRIFGVTLFSIGVVILVVGFVLYGNHGSPYPDPPQDEAVKLYAADGSARLDSFLWIGVMLLLLGMFVSLTSLIACAVTAKWVLVTNVLLSVVSAPFWLGNIGPHAPFAMLIILNAFLAPLALPFTLGPWIFLRRSNPLPIA